METEGPTMNLRYYLFAWRSWRFLVYPMYISPQCVASSWGFFTIVFHYILKIIYTGDLTVCLIYTLFTLICHYYGAGMIAAAVARCWHRRCERRSGTWLPDSFILDNWVVLVWGVGGGGHCTMGSGSLSLLWCCLLFPCRCQMLDSCEFSILLMMLKRIEFW
jgi:hypothetical protein